MIRPELRDGFAKWRDVLIGLAVAVLGAWWATTTFGIFAYVGYAVIALGVVLMIGGWQRMRFQTEGQGPGVVQIVERRLSYFGPLTGGTIDMDDAVRLELIRSGTPAHWRVSGAEGQVDIPVNAKGSDVLFDVFASLPEIDMGAVVGAVQDSATTDQVLWQRKSLLT